MSSCTLVAEIVGGPPPQALGATAAEARHALERCRNRMKLAAEAHGGRTSSQFAPDLRAGFDSVDAAVLAGCEMLDRVHALPPVRGARFGLRIGIHAGTADAPGTAREAERLSELARAGEILLGPSAASRLGAQVRQFAHAGEQERPGLGAGMLAIVRHHSPVSASACDGSPRLRIRHGGRTLYVDVSHPRLELGRDATCDLVVSHPRASRRHASIAYRNGEFFLIDHSTNGCWIAKPDRPLTCVKANEASLTGEGFVGAGFTPADTEIDLIEFELR